MTKETAGVWKKVFLIFYRRGWKSAKGGREKSEAYMREVRFIKCPPLRTGKKRGGGKEALVTFCGRGGRQDDAQSGGGTPLI